MTLLSPLKISMPMQVAFHDVDSYRVVWHGNYAKYFEVIRCQLLAAIDFTYNDMEQTGYFYPVVEMQQKYIRPLMFEQVFEVTAEIIAWENKLVIEYRIYTDSDNNKVLTTKAQTTQFAVKMPEQITQFESPRSLIDKIEKALEKQSAKEQI